MELKPATRTTQGTYFKFDKNRNIWRAQACSKVRALTCKVCSRQDQSKICNLTIHDTFIGCTGFSVDGHA